MQIRKNSPQVAAVLWRCTPSKGLRIESNNGALGTLLGCMKRDRQPSLVGVPDNFYSRFFPTSTCVCSIGENSQPHWPLFYCPWRPLIGLHVSARGTSVVTNPVRTSPIATLVTNATTQEQMLSRCFVAWCIVSVF